MQRTGFMFTCDQCGKSVFVPYCHEQTPSEMEGWMTTSSCFYDENYRRVNKSYDLCPACTKSHKTLLNKIIKKLWP